MAPLPAGWAAHEDAADDRASAGWTQGAGARLAGRDAAAAALALLAATLALLALLVRRRYRDILRRATKSLITFQTAAVTRNTLHLSNVTASPALLAALRFPVAVNTAHIRSLQLTLARWHILVRLSGLDVQLRRSAAPPPVDRAQHEKRAREARRRQHDSQLRAVESLLWDVNVTSAASRVVLALTNAAIFCVASVLNIEIREATVTLEDTSKDTPSFARLVVGEFGVRRETPEERSQSKRPRTFSVGALRLQTHVKGVKVFVRTSEHLVPVVHRWGATAHVIWRGAAIRAPRITSDKDPAGDAELDVHIDASALVMHLSPQVCEFLTRTGADFAVDQRHWRFRRLRPTADVARAPELWWRHAAQCVLDERRALFRQRTQTPLAELTARRESRLAHESAYAAVVSTGQGVSELAKLEEALGVERAALFRWWFWAKESASREEALAKFQSMAKILDATGPVPVMPSHKVAMRMHMAYPKLGVVLHTDDTREDDELEISALDVGTTVIIGLKGKDTVLSGAGALDTRVVCRALHVTPRRAREQDGVWLVQCPPRGARMWRAEEHPPAPELSPGSDSVKQMEHLSSKSTTPPPPPQHTTASAFLTLHYRVPPLQSNRSTLLTVEMDPMDILFSHFWFRKLIAFVAPSVTILKETRRRLMCSIEDDIVSATRRSESRRRGRITQSDRLILARYRHTGTVVRTRLGELCLILPCTPAAAEDATMLRRGLPNPSILVVLSDTQLLSFNNINGSDLGHESNPASDWRHEEGGALHALLSAHDSGSHFSQNLLISADISVWMADEGGGTTPASISSSCTPILDSTRLQSMASQYNEVYFDESGELGVYHVSLLKLNADRRICVTMSPHVVRNGAAFVQSLDKLVMSSPSSVASQATDESTRYAHPEDGVVALRRERLKKVLSLRVSVPCVRLALCDDGPRACTIATTELRRTNVSLVQRTQGWELSYSVDCIIVEQGSMPANTSDAGRAGGQKSDLFASPASCASGTLPPVDSDNDNSPNAASSNAPFGLLSQRSICPLLPMRILKRAYPSPWSRLFCSFKVWRRVLNKAKRSGPREWLRKMLDDSNPQFSGIISFRLDLQETTVVNHFSMLSLSLSIGVLQDLLRAGRRFRAAAAFFQPTAPTSPRATSDPQAAEKAASLRVQLHMGCSRLYVWMDEKPFVSAIIEDLRMEAHKHKLLAPSGHVVSSTSLSGSVESLTVLYLKSTDQPLEILEPYRHVITCDTEESVPAIKFSHRSHESLVCEGVGRFNAGEGAEELHDLRDVALEDDLEIHDIIKSPIRAVEMHGQQTRRHPRARIGGAAPDTMITLNDVTVYVHIRFVKDVRFFVGKLIGTLNELGRERSTARSLSGDLSALPESSDASSGATGKADATATRADDVRHPKACIRVMCLQVDMPLNSLSTEKYRLVAQQVVTYLPAPCSLYKRLAAKAAARRTKQDSPLRSQMGGRESSPCIRSPSCMHPLSRGNSCASHDEAGTRDALHGELGKEFMDTMFDMFASLDEGDDAKQGDDSDSERTLDVIAELQHWSIYWMMLDSSGNHSHVRKCIDPGDAVVAMYFAPKFRLLTDFPYLSAVFGEIQYTLLMGLIYDNSCEPCSFSPPPPHKLRPGFPQPIPPLAPKTLGLDEAAVPWWEIVVRVPDALIAVEKGAVGDVRYDRGVGSPLGLVDLKELVVVVGGAYTCRSMRIRVHSRGVKISDARLSMSDGVMRGIIDALNAAYADQAKSGSTSDEHPLTQYSTIPMFSHNWAPFKKSEEAFKLDYVIQAIDGESGPHVIEIQLSNTELQWPYEKDMEFIMDIAAVYSNYTYRPFCQMYPDLPPVYYDRIPWFYVNVVVEHSHLRAPVPLVRPSTWRDGLMQAPTHELVLAWNALHVGYFWGGDGQVELLVDTRGLKLDGVWLDPVSRARQRSEVLRPVNADVGIEFSTSRTDPKAPVMVDAKIRVGELFIDLSFNAIEMILRAIHAVKGIVCVESKEDTSEGAVGDGDVVEIIPMPETPHAPPRMRIFKLKAKVDGLNVTLVNDASQGASMREMRQGNDKRASKFKRAASLFARRSASFVSHQSSTSLAGAPRHVVDDDGSRLDIFRAYVHECKLSIIQETFVPQSLPAARAPTNDTAVRFSASEFSRSDSGDSFSDSGGGSAFSESLRIARSESYGNAHLPSTSSGETESTIPHQAHVSHTTIELEARLGADCLDSSTDAMDVTIEKWPIEVEFNKHSETTSVRVLSNKRMKASFGPSQLEAVKDMTRFIKTWKMTSSELEQLAKLKARYRHQNMPHSGSDISLSQRAMHVPPAKDGGGSEPSAASENTMLYRIRNKTGITIYFTPDSSTESADPTPRSAKLRSGSASSAPTSTAPQKVEPNQDLPLRNRIIAISFGRSDWRPIRRVRVDRVGRFAAWIHGVGSASKQYGSAGSTGLFPLVFETELHGRQKVLTVTSRVLVDYALPLSRQPEHHQPSDVMLVMRLPADVGSKAWAQDAAEANGASRAGRRDGASGGTSTLTLGPFEPGDVCPMPLGVKKGCRLYIKAQGCNVAEKDVIDLDPSKLAFQEGIIKCPAKEAGDPDVHFFLRVKKDSIPEHVSENQGNPGDEPRVVDVYRLELCTPLALRNLLPVSVRIKLSSDEDEHDYYLDPGQSHEVQEFDMGKAIHLKLFISSSWRSDRDAIVYHPISGAGSSMAVGLARKTRTLLSDLPGLRVGSEIRIKDTSGEAKNSSLRLRFETQSAENSDVCPPFRTVSLWAPYWLVNNTDINLHVRDAFGRARAFLPTKSGSRSPTVVREIDEHSTFEVGTSMNWDRKHVPIMYSGSSYAGYNKFSVDGKRWSRRVSFDSVGLRVRMAVKSKVSIGKSFARRFSGRSDGETSTATSRNSRTLEGSESSQSLRQRRSGQLSVMREQGSKAKHWRIQQRHDFGVQIVHAPEPFNLTKVVILSNRIVIHNSTTCELELRQRGADVGYFHNLSVDYTMPFHWDDATKPMEIEMRPAEDEESWKWSGRIRLEKEGRFGIRVVSADESEQWGTQRIFLVDVRLVLTTLQVTFLDARDDPPYRIVNESSVRLMYWQRETRPEIRKAFLRAKGGAGGNADTSNAGTTEMSEGLGLHDSVSPGETRDYAWDEPSLGNRRLRVFAEGSMGPRDFALDNLSFDQMQSILVHTDTAVDSAAAAAANAIAHSQQTASGSGDSHTQAPGSRTKLGSIFVQGMRDFVMNDRSLAAQRKMVYVSVTAEGSTRVVRFSDSQLATMETEKEKEAKLARRLEQLDEHLAQANEELKRFAQDSLVFETSFQHTPTSSVAQSQRSGAPGGLDDKPIETGPTKALDKQESRNRFDFTPHVWKRSSTAINDERTPSDSEDGDNGNATGDPDAGDGQPAWKKSRRNRSRRFSIALFSNKKSRSFNPTTPDVLTRGPKLQNSFSMPGRQHRSDDGTLSTAGDLAGVSTTNLGPPFRRSSTLEKAHTLKMPPHSLRVRTRRSSSAGESDAIFAQSFDDDAHPEEAQASAANAGGNAGVAPAVSMHSQSTNKVMGGELIVFLDRGEDLVPPERAGKCDTYAVLTIMSDDDAIAGDGQQAGVKRTVKTPIVRRSASPLFQREEIFTSVHSDDTLVISLFEKDRRLGPFHNDEFLGEHHILLHEVETRPDKVATPLRYQLARRTAKDRVQGSVYLFLSWNVNPVEQNRMMLRLKGRELEEKRERIAKLVDERCETGLHTTPFILDERRLELVLNTKLLNSTIAPLFVTPAEPNSASSPHASRSPNARLTDLGRRRSGQMRVRVIAARGLSSSVANKYSVADSNILVRAMSSGMNFIGSNFALQFAGMLPLIEGRGRGESATSDAGTGHSPTLASDAPAYADVAGATFDCYVSIGLDDREEAQTTSVVGARPDPEWDEEKVFGNVDPNSKLLLRLYHPRRMHRDVLIGEARICLRELTSGQPVYAWIPLHTLTRGHDGDAWDTSAGGGTGRSGASRSESLRAGTSSASQRREVGELRVRLQWQTNLDLKVAGRESVASDAPSTTLQLRLNGFGISLFERKELGAQREWMHILLEDVALILRQDVSPTSATTGTKSKRELHFALGSAQIDNQLMSAQEPVVLARHTLSSYDKRRDETMRKLEKSTHHIRRSVITSQPRYAHDVDSNDAHDLHTPAVAIDRPFMNDYLRSPASHVDRGLARQMDSLAFCTVYDNFCNARDASSPSILGATGQADAMGTLREESRPLVFVQIDMSSDTHFDRFLVDMQPVDVHLDEEFLLTAVGFVQTLAGTSKESNDINDTQEEDAGDPERVLSSFFESCYNSFAGIDSRVRVNDTAKRGDWLYFRDLDIRELVVHLTLTRSPNAESQRRHLATVMGLNFVDVNGVPLKLAQIHFADLFELPDELKKRLMNTVMSTILFEFYKILGTVDFLGTPVALLSSVGAGVVDFFANPARGMMSSPEDFARGMATGTVSLLRNSMFGVFNTAAQVTGSMSKGLAALSMDDDFIMQLKAPTRSTNDNTMLRGVQDLGFGLIQGVSGLVYDPIRGAEREGLIGFLKGLASGIAGIAVKPAAGVFEFAAKTASSVGGGIATFGDDLGRKARRRIDSSRMRIAPPKSTGTVAMGAGASADALVSAWKPELAFRIGGGVFAEDTPMEYVATGVARGPNGVLFTDKRIIVLSIHRRVIWTSEYKDVQLVSSNQRKLTTNLLCNVRVMPIRITVPSAMLCCIGALPGRDRRAGSQRTVKLRGLKVPWHRQLRCNSRDAHTQLHSTAAHMIARHSGRGGESDVSSAFVETRDLQSFKKQGDFTLLPESSGAVAKESNVDEISEKDVPVAKDVTGTLDPDKRLSDREEGEPPAAPLDPEPAQVLVAAEAADEVVAAAASSSTVAPGGDVPDVAAHAGLVGCDAGALAAALDAAAHVCERGVRSGAPTGLEHYASAAVAICTAAAEAASAAHATDLAALGHAMGLLLGGYRAGKVFPEQLLSGLHAVAIEARDACLRTAAAGGNRSSSASGGDAATDEIVENDTLYTL